MLEFRSKAVAELARQMRFTPHDKRLEQLGAAEELLLSLNASQSYPLDYVTDRVTGYRPKSPTIELIPARDLHHDLGLLLETVSQTTGLFANDAAEPVLTIDELAGRLNITSKTIQRWRRRGLPARCFVFGDGKQRIGFFLSSVDRFMRAHAQEAGSLQSADAAEPLGGTNADAIIRNARRLALQGCWAEEIARRLAGRFSCSPLAVLSYLRQDDLRTPKQALALDTHAGPSDAAKRRVIRAIDEGLSLKDTAERVGLCRYAVYRIAMDHRLARLSSRRMSFVDDPLYHQADAEEVISAIASQRPIAPPAAVESERIPRDLPPYLRDLYRVPLFSPQEERAAFLEYNYRKFRLVSARRQLDATTARHRNLENVERLAAAAATTRNRIVAANLRLVVSVARKHLRAGLSLMELISEGNLTLMRTVESFDIHRGHRFSTYATFALMRGFARAIPQMLSRLHTPSLDQEEAPQIPDPRTSRNVDMLEAQERVNGLLSRLEPRERDVLAGYFGLGPRPVGESYQEIGQRLGISRQRVRQIEQAALAKLRVTCE